MKKTLSVIFLITLLLLGTAFGLKDLTLQRSQEAHIWLMETLLPGGKDFVKLPDADDDSAIRSVHQCDAGYVIETATEGYADEVTMYIGVSNQGKVTGLVTYRSHETLGLGSRILTDHEFLAQFLNKGGSFTIGTAGADAFSGATAETPSAGEEITVDGISGATVSSKAVARCVSAAVAYVTGADIVSSATSWGG